MSHLTAETIAPGRTLSGMMDRRRTGNQTLGSSGIVVAIALAIFLSWLFFWSASNSFSVSEADRSGGGFDGYSFPFIAPYPAGEQLFRVTIGDSDTGTRPQLERPMAHRTS
jgi:hypothetical protein